MFIDVDDDGVVAGLAIQRLAAALRRGDCRRAEQRLDEMVAASPRARELVERGRYAANGVLPFNIPGLTCLGDASAGVAA